MYGCIHDGSVDVDNNNGNENEDDDNSPAESSSTNEAQLGEAQTAKREDSMNT